MIRKKTNGARHRQPSSIQVRKACTLTDIFFNPQGRLVPADFLWAGYVLILIGAGFQILGLVSFDLAQKINWLSYALIYPWTVIWIKRLHEGGKPGIMFLSYVLLYFILSTLGFLLVDRVFGHGQFMTLIQATMEQTVPETEIETRLMAWAKSIMLPMAISSILVSLVVLHIGNITIGQDPNDNRWGPAPPNPDVFD